jgi:hypothetical protein
MTPFPVSRPDGRSPFRVNQDDNIPRILGMKRQSREHSSQDPGTDHATDPIHLGCPRGSRSARCCTWSVECHVAFMVPATELDNLAGRTKVHRGGPYIGRSDANRLGPALAASASKACGACVRVPSQVSHRRLPSRRRRPVLRPRPRLYKVGVESKVFTRRSRS